MSVFFLEELDECEFLFGIQTVAYMSHLGGSFVDNRIFLMSVSSGWMDILEVLALGMTGLGRGTQPWLASSLGALRMPVIYQ
jgi:hypothetical protein